MQKICARFWLLTTVALLTVGSGQSLPDAPARGTGAEGERGGASRVNDAGALLHSEVEDGAHAAEENVLRILEDRTVKDAVLTSGTLASIVGFAVQELTVLAPNASSDCDVDLLKPSARVDASNAAADSLNIGWGIMLLCDNHHSRLRVGGTAELRVTAPDAKLTVSGFSITSMTQESVHSQGLPHADDVNREDQNVIRQVHTDVDASTDSAGVQGGQETALETRETGGIGDGGVVVDLFEQEPGLRSRAERFVATSLNNEQMSDGIMGFLTDLGVEMGPGTGAARHAELTGEVVLADTAFLPAVVYDATVKIIKVLAGLAKATEMG